MLRLEGLRLRQGEFTLTADIEVPAGGVSAVMGPSGGGKSTLLAAVGGFLAPEAGRISWEGGDLGHLPPARRPVAMLFQDNNLFPHLSVARNVGLGLSPRLKLSEAEWRRVERVLGRVGLAGYGPRRPAELSGGQQSRAALARVLVQDQPLVLLDEPFAALGPAMRREMLDLTREMLADEGRTLLMVSHDPADAERIAERVVVVEGGGAQGPFGTAELLSDPPEGLRAYLGSR